MTQSKSERIDQGVTIRLLGTSWWIDVCKDGERRRWNLKTSTRDLARSLAREQAAAILSGRWNINLAAEMTFERAVKRFTEEYEVSHHAPGTREYTKILFRKFEEFISKLHGKPGVTLDRITSGDIETYQRERMQTVTIRKTKISAHTVNRDIRELAILFSWAKKHGGCRINPCEDVKPIRAVKRVKRVLNGDERTKLIAALPHLLADLTRFLLNTGMRLGEALHLRGEDVVLDAETPHVVLRSRPEYRIKTSSERKIGLAEPLVKMLRPRKLAAGASGLIFRTPRASTRFHKKPNPLGLLSKRNVLRSLKMYAVRAGIERPQEVNFYTLRHTALTTMAMYMPPMMLKTVAGHASIRTTEGYIHLTGTEVAPRVIV